MRHLLALVFLISIATPASAQNFKNYLDSQWTTHQSTFNSQVNSGSAPTYYYLQYALLGWNSAYEAFGDIAYLQRTLLYAEIMVAKANALAGDVCGGVTYRSWSENSGTISYGSCSVTNKGTLLNEFQGASEMAWTVQLILNDPVLSAQTQSGFGSTYGARANAVRAWLKTHMIAKWQARGGALMNLINGTGNTAAADKGTLVATTLLGLDLAGDSSVVITSGVTYRQAIITRINKTLALASIPTADLPCGTGTCVGGFAAANAEIIYFKGYTGTTYCGYVGNSCDPDTVSPCSPDVAHQNRKSVLFQRAVDAGFSTLVNSTPSGTTLAQLVSKLNNAITEITWNNSTATPQFTNYTDGNNHCFRSLDPWKNGFISNGTALTAHHSADGVNAMVAMMNCVIAGSSCTSLSRAVNDCGSNPVCRTGLAGTTSLAQLRFSGGGTPTPILNTSPASLNYTGFVGGSQPVPQNLTVADGASSGAMGWTVTDDQSWITVSPDSGNNAGTIIVTVDTTGLAAGVHNGNVTVTADEATGSPDIIPIQLTLTPPTLTRSPTTLSFSSILGAGNPVSQAITIIDTADSGVMSWTITDDVGWISVTPSSGIDDAVVTVNIDVTGLPVAVHNGTITITSTGSVNSPLTVAVDLTITSPPAPPCQRCGGRIR